MFEDELDKMAEGLPKLVEICEKINVRPGYVLGATASLVVIFGTILQG